MKKEKLSVHKEKLIAWLFMSLAVIFFIVLFSLKGTINNYVSKSLQAQVEYAEKETLTSYLDSAFNYTYNNKSFQVTFLEFGSKICSSCKQMEGVMEEIRVKYPDTVNVVFIDIMEPENQNMLKYFGIALIPAQVLLNRQGKEFFRHTGYFSAVELEGEIFKK